MRYTTFLISIISITLFGCSRPSNPDLERLDNVVANHPQYLQKRISEIDSLRRAKYPSAFDREMALQSAMGSLSLDSAITHTEHAIDLAQTPDQLAAARLAQVRHYIRAGVTHKEASDLFSTVDIQSITDPDIRFEYYSCGVQLNQLLADYTLNPDLRSAYTRRKVECRDSALLLQPDNDVLLANRYRDTGDYGRAITLLKRPTDGQTFTRADAVRYNILANLYQDTNDADNRRRYLTYSATADLMQGVREYLSLQNLAMVLYQEGDNERAYRYINQSIDDATACNAKQRMLEMSTMMPIIQKAHEESRRHTFLAQFLFSVLLFLSLLGVVISIIIIRRKNRKLEAANLEQQSLNRQLTESDSIKEEYVTQFMNLCLEYLAQMEGYRHHLLRTAAHRNFEELIKAIKSSKYIGKGIHEFYEKFDEAFLEMFPNFVRNLRRLLQPNYELHLKDDRHLNTELRMLALMRLGITDSDSICKFLRCSPSTIYNYRTRLRAAALDRDTFDTALQSL